MKSGLIIFRIFIVSEICCLLCFFPPRPSTTYSLSSTSDFFTISPASICISDVDPLHTFFKTTSDPYSNPTCILDKPASANLLISFNPFFTIY